MIHKIHFLQLFFYFEEMTRKQFLATGVVVTGYHYGYNR